MRLLVSMMLVLVLGFIMSGCTGARESERESRPVAEENTSGTTVEPARTEPSLSTPPVAPPSKARVVTDDVEEDDDEIVEEEEFPEEDYK